MQAPSLLISDDCLGMAFLELTQKYVGIPRYQESHRNESFWALEHLHPAAFKGLGLLASPLT